MKKIGIEPKSDVKSLKLFEMLIQLASIAKESGLNLIKNSEELKNRFNEYSQMTTSQKNNSTPIGTLYLLNEFRIEDAHYRNKINDLLRQLNVTRNDLKEGWGLLLDKWYDTLAKSLEDINDALSASIDS